MTSISSFFSFSSLNANVPLLAIVPRLFSRSSLFIPQPLSLIVSSLFSLSILIFELLIVNKSTKDIANNLQISEKTVRNHISNSMQKLGVKGRASAVIELLKLGEISL